MGLNRLTSIAPAVGLWLFLPSLASGAGLSLTHSGSPMTVKVRNDVPGRFVGRFNAGVASGPGYLCRFPEEPFSSYTTLRVNGVDSVFGDTTGGTLVQAPAIGSSGLTTIWSASGVSVLQTMSFGPAPGAGQTSALRISYQLTNATNQAKQVGLRIFLDTDVAGSPSAPIEPPGGSGPFFAETELTGNQVPPWLGIHDVWPTPGTSARLWLQGGQGVTKPDRLIVASAFMAGRNKGLAHYPWAYPQPLGPSKLTDTSLALYWDPAVLDGGATRSIAVVLGEQPGSGSDSNRTARKRAGIPVARVASDESPSAQSTPARGVRVSNPADRAIHIQVPPSGSGHASVFFLRNLAGEVVRRHAVLSERSAVDVSGLRAGVYTWTILDGRRTRSRGSLTVRHAVAVVDLHGSAP